MTPIMMVSIECVCLAFMLVVLSAYIFLPRSESLKGDWFFYSMLAMILGIIGDAVAWACEITPAPQLLQVTGNTVCLMTSGFITSFFAYYVITLINEKKHLSMWYARVIAIVNLIGTAILLITAISGKLYYIHSNPETPGVKIYDAGSWAYDIPNYLSATSLIVLFILVLLNAETLGKKKIIVFSIYFILPIIAGILELVVDNFQLSYVTIAISMSIVYVMLQSKHMDDLILREELLNEWSYLDSLTGLQNRRACDRDMQEVKQDAKVSVAFCDLNGLKKVNDEQGHEAGDRFLMKFSEILTSHFSHDSVYRISGDEFVVIARNMTTEEFESKIAALRREIDENAGIAALGTISGTGDTISMLIKRAEMSMYDDKKKFYRQYPDYRRDDARFCK